MSLGFTAVCVEIGQLSDQTVRLTTCLVDCAQPDRASDDVSGCEGKVRWWYIWGGAIINMAYDVSVSINEE